MQRSLSYPYCQSHSYDKSKCRIILSSLYHLIILMRQSGSNNYCHNYHHIQKKRTI